MFKEFCLIGFGMVICFVLCLLYTPLGVTQTVPIQCEKQPIEYQTETVNVINGIFSTGDESITVRTMARTPAEIEKTLLHEYKHFLDYYTLGKETYIGMSREDREASASLYEQTHYFCEGD